MFPDDETLQVSECPVQSWGSIYSAAYTAPKLSAETSFCLAHKLPGLGPVCCANVVPQKFRPLMQLALTRCLNFVLLVTVTAATVIMGSP